jgi:hypothetical protein
MDLFGFTPKASGIAKRVRDILIENYDYYNFCEQCLGSDNDLLAW